MASEKFSQPDPEYDTGKEQVHGRLGEYVDFEINDQITVIHNSGAVETGWAVDNIRAVNGVDYLDVTKSDPVTNKLLVKTVRRSDALANQLNPEAVTDVDMIDNQAVVQELTAMRARYADAHAEKGHADLEKAIKAIDDRIGNFVTEQREHAGERIQHNLEILGNSKRLRRVVGDTATHAVEKVWRGFNQVRNTVGVPAQVIRELLTSKAERVKEKKDRQLENSQEQLDRLNSVSAMAKKSSRVQRKIARAEERLEDAQSEAADASDKLDNRRKKSQTSADDRLRRIEKPGQWSDEAREARVKELRQKADEALARKALRHQLREQDGLSRRESKEATENAFAELSQHNPKLFRTLTSLAGEHAAAERNVKSTDLDVRRLSRDISKLSHLRQEIKERADEHQKAADDAKARIESIDNNSRKKAAVEQARKDVFTLQDRRRKLPEDDEAGRKKLEQEIDEARAIFASYDNLLAETIDQQMAADKATEQFNDYASQVTALEAELLIAREKQRDAQYEQSTRAMQLGAAAERAAKYDYQAEKTAEQNTATAKKLAFKQNHRKTTIVQEFSKASYPDPMGQIASGQSFGKYIDANRSWFDSLKDDQQNQLEELFAQAKAYYEK